MLVIRIYYNLEAADRGQDIQWKGRYFVKRIQTGQNKYPRR